MACVDIYNCPTKEPQKSGLWDQIQYVYSMFRNLNIYAIADLDSKLRVL